MESHNARSIGIELYQRDISMFGNDASKLDFTDWQYDTAAMLVFNIRRRWGIKQSMVVSHQSINTKDRADPRNFDWIGFNRRVHRIESFVALLGTSHKAP